MYNLFMRFKLNKALKLIKKYWDNKLPLDTILNKIDFPTLLALEQYQCIKLSKAWGDVVTEINYGPKSHIYSIERSELWFNRICSYILGIISGLIIGIITKLFFS